MGFFQLFTQSKINDYVKEAGQLPSSILLDVRTPEEYIQGHIPGSVNIPLQDLEKASEILTDSSSPLYVYCQSGARSGLAVMLLKKMGYHKIQDMGGISGWRGTLETGGN